MNICCAYPGGAERSDLDPRCTAHLTTRPHR
jgi:hypothetical protein